MRAIYFEKPGDPLRVASMPDPEPGEGEMVIAVRRCGICGSDVHGLYPEQCVLGHEYAGEIVAIGKGVEGYRIGDPIAAMPGAGCGRCATCIRGAFLLCELGMKTYIGGLADFVRVSASTAIHLPQSLSMSDGALVEPMAVGLHAVTLAKIHTGARVQIVGAGPIGLSVAYWARRLGAGRIVTMSRSRRRADMALTMGADSFVTSGPDEVEDVRKALGGPPQFVFETIGVVGGLQQSIDHVAMCGTVVSVGLCLQPDPVSAMISTFKQVTVQFSFAYTLGEFEYCANTLDKGHVDPKRMISDTIALEAVPEMLERMRAGNANTLKVQVDLSL